MIQSAEFDIYNKWDFSLSRTNSGATRFWSFLLFDWLYLRTEREREREREQAQFFIPTTTTFQGCTIMNGDKRRRRRLKHIPSIFSQIIEKVQKGTLDFIHSGDNWGRKNK